MSAIIFNMMYNIVTDSETGNYFSVVVDELEKK